MVGKMAEPSRCSMQVRIAIAVIGIIVGVSVLFCFGIVFRNWDAAVWGFVSGIFAAVTLAVHIKQNQGAWQKSVKPLKPLMFLGCFVQLAGVCGFVAYLAIAISEHQPVTAYDDGYYVVAVWCFMTWKWGFQLFFFSRQYRRLYKYKASKEVSRGDYEKLPS